MFYSKSRNGFFDEAIHGSRKLTVPDPAWVRPVIDGTPDLNAVAPLIEVDNPACAMPPDVVAITAQQHAELMNAQSAGMMIVPDVSGMPTARAAPPLSFVDLKNQALAQARTQRQPILSVLDGMQASALAKGETVKATAIETAKQGLKDLTKIDLSACVTPEDFKAKIMLRYREIAAALPADVRTAFAEALQ